MLRDTDPCVIDSIKPMHCLGNAIVIKDRHIRLPGFNFMCLYSCTNTASGICAFTDMKTIRMGCKYHK